MSRYQSHVLGIGSLWIVLLCVPGITRDAGARQTITASPTPGACDVDPRSVSEIQALAATAADERAPAGPLPIGTPADEETIVAIGRTLHDMSACLTAGQMLRFYALHSDAWLRRFSAGIADLTTYTTSTPPLYDGQTAVYQGPWHVQILPDGRVMAAVLLRIGEELHPDPQRVRVLLFVIQDGQWLVDETIENVMIPDCESPVAVAAVVGPPPGQVFAVWLAPC